MARSLKKGFFYPEAVARKVKKARETGIKTPIKLMERSSIITEDCIGLSFAVHNGKSYIPLKVTANHVGRKFGEYAETKKFGGHSGEKKSTLKK